MSFLFLLKITWLMMGAAPSKDYSASSYAAIGKSQLVSF
jgi:hypothetical protein